MRNVFKKHPGFVICLSLIFLTAAAFEPVRHNDFVNYDDNVYVTENRNVTVGLTADSIVWAFITSHFSNWHPVTWLSHQFDCQLFGLNPFWHHMTSLIFHIANTLLLFCVLNRMTKALWPSAFVAAAFALHPLHVESVAWVSERKDVLSTFFWMLTMAAYIRYAEKPKVGRYLLVAAALCLGLMAKPMLVTLPFVLLLLDYWPLCRFRWARRDQNLFESANFPYKSATTLHLIVEKIPLLIIVIISCAVTYLVQQSGGAVRLGETFPLKLRIANALISYVSYIVKMFYPASLAILYPHPGESLPLWQSHVSLALLVVISVLIILAARRRGFLLVGWFWYLGTLVPVIGFVQVGVQAMADRYTYVPSIGIFIMLAWAFARLFRKWSFPKLPAAVLPGVLIAAMLICTRMQLRYWRDNFTLFEHALDVTENNYIMHSNFGGALFQKGRFDEAIDHHKQALKINPGFADAHRDIGFVLLKQQKTDQAIAAFEQALQMKEDWPELYNCLGLAYAQNGRDAEAVTHFTSALEINPRYFKAHNGLGNIYLKQGKIDAAFDHFNESLEISPDYYKALNNMGIVLKQQGKTESAVEKWKQALKVKPDYANAHHSLGLFMAETGKHDEAVEHFKAALSSRPDWPEAHYNLASLYYRQGKPDLCVKECAEALSIKPDYLIARTTMAYTLAETGQAARAIEHYYAALEFEPNHLFTLRNLAWILATTNDAKLRNPDAAVELAQKACEISGYSSVKELDILAAAYAWAGKFDQAVKTSQKALDIALSEKNNDLAVQIQQKLQLYKAGKTVY